MPDFTRSDDLSTRLLAKIAEAEQYANAMLHDNPDEGGYYACPATRTEPYGDLEYGEDACDCGMPARRAEALRFCQAHREIVELAMVCRADVGLAEEKLEEAAATSRREYFTAAKAAEASEARLVLAEHYLTILAHGYGIEA